MDWTNGLSAFSYCMEMLIAVYLYLIHLEKRKMFWGRITAGMAVLFLSAMFVNPWFSQTTVAWGWFIVVFFLIIGICFFSCSIGLEDAVYAASCGYLTQHFASSLYILIRYQGSAPTWEGLLYYLVYAIVYCLFYFLFARKIAENGHYHVTWQTALTVMVLVLGVTIALSMFTKIAADDANVDLVYSVGNGLSRLFRSTQIYAMLFCVFFLWMQVLQRKELQAVRKLEQSELLWQQRQAQYQMSRDNIDLINRKCHDLKHQIAALSAVEGQSMKREALISEIQDMVEVYDTKTDTGNEALNTILMEKGLYCRMHGIQWTCVADGKLLDFIDVIDLYTLIGNAVDNAIEAVEKLEEPENRIVSVRIWQKAAFAVLQVENYFAGTVEMADGLPVTSKGDTFSHGIGLKSMRRIVEKYQGSLSVKAEGGMFLLSCVFPLEQ